MIKEPKKRSARWVSTSIPQSEWDSALALHSSAEYHVNNLVSPVLFQEGLSLVPENAVVLEIAPHALLQVCYQCCPHMWGCFLCVPVCVCVCQPPHTAFSSRRCLKLFSPHTPVQMLLGDVLYRDTSLWLGGVTVGNQGCKAFHSLL